MKRFLAVIFTVGSVIVAAPPASGEPANFATAPTADAYVNSDQPDQNAGMSRSLYADGAPNVANSYLSFDLSQLTGLQLTSATLRLVATSGQHAGSAGSIEIRDASGTAWIERGSSGVTFDTRPPIGDIVGTIDGVDRNEVVLVNLATSGLHPGPDGVLTLALTTSSADGAFFWSREVAEPELRPELVVISDNQSSPVVVAVGDIACRENLPTPTACQYQATSDLAIALAPDAVLALGDLQYTTGALASFMAEYEPTWGRLRSITWPVPGNHEYTTPGASGYYDYFYPPTDLEIRAKGYYSFDLGQWHLIALNSNCSYVSCAAGQSQEEWLRADLAATSAQCILAFWHHPRFTSGTRGPYLGVQPLVDALYERGVDVILNGHNHFYERFVLQDRIGAADPAAGFREFIVGTGGKEVLNLGVGTHPNREVRNTDSFGVLKLTLHAGSYDWEFVPAPGSSFVDSGSDLCR